MVQPAMPMNTVGIQPSMGVSMGPGMMMRRPVGVVGPGMGMGMAMENNMFHHSMPGGYGGTQPPGYGGIQPGNCGGMQPDSYGGMQPDSGGKSDKQ